MHTASDFEAAPIQAGQQTSSDATAPHVVGTAHNPVPASVPLAGDDSDGCVGKGGGEDMVPSRLSKAHSRAAEDSESGDPRGDTRRA